MVEYNYVNTLYDVYTMYIMQTQELYKFTNIVVTKGMGSFVTLHKLLHLNGQTNKIGVAYTI